VSPLRFFDVGLDLNELRLTRGREDVASVRYAAIACSIRSSTRVNVTASLDHRFFQLQPGVCPYCIVNAPTTSGFSRCSCSTERCGRARATEDSDAQNVHRVPRCGPGDRGLDPAGHHTVMSQDHENIRERSRC